MSRLCESHHVVAKDVEVDTLMVTLHSISSDISHHLRKLRKHSKQILSHRLKEAYKFGGIIDCILAQIVP